MTEAPRFLQIRSNEVLLLGPQGVGKMAWIEQQFPDALMVDLADPVKRHEAMARPNEVLRPPPGSEHPAVVAIGDVQRWPEVLHHVKRAVSDGRFAGCIVTGTSLRRIGDQAELAGLEQRSVHPLMAAEVGEGFQLERGLQFGMLPMAWAVEDPGPAMRTRTAALFHEEVHAPGLVREAGGFARFLEAVSFFHSGVLNLASVARECGVSRTTAEGFLGVLEDLLLAWRLPVFAQGSDRGLAAHPRFYFFDTGVFRVLRPPADRPGEIEDAALKGLVAQHLRAWCDYSTGGHALHHWMTRTGLGVDFVVHGETGVFALEVRNILSVRAADLRGLRAFGRAHPESRRVLLHRGRERFEHEGVSCIPCEEFLRSLTPG
jgi:predicted AAA+ superfamily ATPase